MKQTGQLVSICRFTPGLFLEVLVFCDYQLLVRMSRRASAGAKCKCKLQMHVYVFVCLCVRVQLWVQSWVWVEDWLPNKKGRTAPTPQKREPTENS